MLFVTLHRVELYVINSLKHNLSIMENFLQYRQKSLAYSNGKLSKTQYFPVPGNSILHALLYLVH